MYSCLAKVHVSRDPSVRSQMSPLPHLPKVSLNCMYSCHPRFMYPGIHPFAPGCLPFPTYPRSASTTTFPKFMYPGCLPFPISLRSAVPSPDQCLQESTYVTSGELPSPLPQGQRYSCRPQDLVSRNPSVYRRISSLPHLPKVSLNCMYSCLAQVHVSRNPSARSGCLPYPISLRSAVPSPDQCLQESTYVT
nr:uncharacterized protein LOC128685657 [Cherax quadricarinatus]